MKNIYVKHGDRNSPYTVTTDTTVAELKHKIAAEEGMITDEIVLIWGGRSLDDNATVCDTFREDGTTIHLVLIYRPK